MNNPVLTHSRPTISAPVAQNKEETGRPYEEIEFEDKKVNGNVSQPARTNGEVLSTKIPQGECVLCLTTGEPECADWSERPCQSALQDVHNAALVARCST